MGLLTTTWKSWSTPKLPPSDKQHLKLSSLRERRKSSCFRSENIHRCFCPSFHYEKTIQYYGSERMSAQWLLDCLTQVGAATDIQSLLKAFQVYSKAMLLLHNLVVERIQDLCDYRQQEHVKASMETLRRCISMLHTAMYTTIKHPTSEEAQNAKKYILHQVDATVNNIITTLKTNCENISTGSCGYYTDRRNRLLRLLSNSDTILLKDGNFVVVLRDLVFHSVAVANSSRREIRSCVTANCKSVLQLWSEISWQTKCSSDKQKAKEHLENFRVALMKQIHKLDDTVVKASLYLVMDTFVLTSDPLEQLLNTVHYISESEADGGLENDPLEPLSKAFMSHADKMAEVAGFISALANDEKSLESVENSRACLMRLKDGVTQLLLELGGDSVQYQGALHKLINIQQKWVEEKEQLLNAFSEVINVKDFVNLAVEEMKRDLNKSVEAHRKQDYCLFGKHVSCLIGRMSQVIQIVRRHVDKSDDPIYRNGLTELLQRQLQAKMMALSGLLSKVNEEYVTAIQNAVSLACSLIVKEDSLEAEDTRKQFEVTTELLLRNVQTATESVQDCFNFIRDPRERTSLRFINDHLLFQMSEIVSRARLMVETQTVFETLKRWDVHGNQIVKVTKEMADKIYHMTQYLKRKGPIQSKNAFVTSAKDVISSCQSITEFVRVIADHCLNKHCTKELSIIREQIVTITNQLTIISSVNAVTPGCKSSDEILVKNAQNLLQTVIQGVRAAETACIKVINVYHHVSNW
uniref:Uncharacterized protein n=1 Tax=Pygocentrus nattereri TaxID=42514 RepID=A0A3B4DMJ1_PYGNA